MASGHSAFGCNNYTTQSTQKEPSGEGATSSTHTKSWENKKHQRNSLISAYSRCRNEIIKKESRLLWFCINFIIFRLVMYLAKSLALTSYGQWPVNTSEAENFLVFFLKKVERVSTTYKMIHLHSLL